MLREKHFIRKHSIEMPDSELHISDPIRIYLNSNEKRLLIKGKKSTTSAIFISGKYSV